MSEVNCECDCRWVGEDGICTNEMLYIGPMGCEDYEDVPQKPCPDKYYAFCVDHDNEFLNKKIARCWDPRMGIKEEFLGREIFLNGYDDNYFTDGITGVSGVKDKLLVKSKEELDKIFAELEENNGISPLYTDNTKWPIKKVSVK